MRVCVFVDGENLRHTICDLFKPHFDRNDYLPKRAEWAQFYDRVVDLATEGRGNRLRTYWYVVEHCEGYPWPLPKPKRTPDELAAWAKRNAKVLKAHLPPSGPERDERLLGMQDELRTSLNSVRSRFDGFATLQNGIMHKHRAIEFRRSGAISFNVLDGKFGEEKTVDVHLAVDMVTLRHNYEVAVIVSGDQDYVPAAQAVKDMGASVVNVAFKARSGVLLPGGARRLNQATDWSVEMDWEETRKLLSIEEVATIEESAEAG